MKVCICVATAALSFYNIVCYKVFLSQDTKLFVHSLPKSSSCEVVTMMTGSLQCPFSDRVLVYWSVVDKCADSYTELCGRQLPAMDRFQYLS